MEIIDPNKPILNPSTQVKADGQTKVKKGEFDAIFKKTVDSTEFKRLRTESATFLSDIRPAQFSAESLPSEKLLVDRVQGLIDTMGIYQQKLIDSGATLKDIQPLVQKMAAESDALRATSNAAEGQKSMKTIVNHSLTLASMEIAKFNSGYYNEG